MRCAMAKKTGALGVAFAALAASAGAAVPEPWKPLPIWGGGSVQNVDAERRVSTRRLFFAGGRQTSIGGAWTSLTI